MEAWYELFHNDQYVVTTYGYKSGSYSYADSGKYVVLHLKKGDTIKIRPCKILMLKCMWKYGWSSTTTTSTSTPSMATLEGTVPKVTRLSWSC